MSLVAPRDADVVGRVRSRVRDEADGISDTHAFVRRAVLEETPLASLSEVQRLSTAVLSELVGLGPLDELCADPAVTDVLVNGPGPVWIERAGRLERTAVDLDLGQIERIIERSMSAIGVRIDRRTPIADGRLADGSRLSVVLPPIALDGPLLTIRRFGARAVHLSEMTEPAVGALLGSCVEDRVNLVVYGGTGSGKTTLLNALGALLPRSERVVVVEDAAELRLPGDHVIRLEARAENVEGVGRVTIRDLVRAALRLRPDRIVVGEVRGPEALDMVWAMSTGHDGSMSTCHANNAVDALARLETFAVLADADLPLPAVRAQVRNAVDVLVGVRRLADGRRRVDAVHRLRRGQEAELVALVTDGVVVGGAR